MMKKLLALVLLAAVFAMGTGAWAEFNADDFSTVFGDDVFETVEDDAEEEDGEADPDGFEVSFDDGGYTGEWVSVNDLEIEFFLPDGWKTGESAEDEYFYAENEDDTAELGIIIYDDKYDGGELSEWAEANLDGEDYTVGVANALDVVVVRDEEIGRILVLVPNAGGYIIGFNFYRASEDVLSDDFAIEIAGTCSDLWV